MLKLVLDTNVFISGIIFGGNARTILNLIIQGKLKLYISDEILSELKDVLQRDKFGFPLKNIYHILNEIDLISELVSPTFHHNIVERDPKDNIVIDCAVAAGVDYVITGDHDLLEMKVFGNIKIISPAGFIKAIRLQ